MAIHTVTDISQITDPNCIYHGKVIGVGDQFDHDDVTAVYSWPVTIDPQGYPEIVPSGGVGTDSFDFDISTDGGSTWLPAPYTWHFTILGQPDGTELTNVDYTLSPRIDSNQLMSDPSGAGGVYVYPATNLRATSVSN